jgi:hypothetical protein
MHWYEPYEPKPISGRKTEVEIEIKTNDVKERTGLCNLYAIFMCRLTLNNDLHTVILVSSFT